MAKLQEVFCVVNPVDAAMQKLALLQQGNRPVESMITDFRLLIGEADLSTTSALKKIIFRDIVPKTIEKWYVKAIQYDSNFRLTQAMMALDNQTPKKNTGRSWFNQNQNNKDPNAMDIGATTRPTGAVLIGTLTEETQAALMKIGACFRCRKTGHLSCNCPLKNQGQQQPQQQKTYTQKDVHMNIRSMTTEQRKEMLTADLGFA